MLNPHVRHGMFTHIPLARISHMAALPAREMVNALLPFENSVLDRGIHALVHGSLVKSAASCALIGEE